MRQPPPKPGLSMMFFWMTPGTPWNQALRLALAEVLRRYGAR
jgi:hypothetical protein